MKKAVCLGVALAAGLVAACGSEAEPTSSVADDLSGGSAHVRQAKKGTSSGGPLIDHGGPVLTSSTTYAIFWGPTSAFPQDEFTGVEQALSGFGGSGYLAIADQYMRGSTATSAFKGAWYLSSAPPSHAPKASDLGNQVCALFPNPDPNGIYFFFTSNYPKVNYCAWHDKATCNGVTFQVAYMPNLQGVSGCSTLQVKNLGCNTMSDATQSLLDGMAHEYMEATTDPQLSAWYDQSGSEIGDKCNFVYGSCVNLSTGSFQLQEEWSNAAGGCVQSL